MKTISYIFITLSIISILEASRLPTFTRGVYLLLADNTASIKDDQGNSVLSTNDWSPKISGWINQFNVVFFTFINSDMVVPPSFENARKSGQIPASTKIIYSIGGYSYSFDNAWQKWFGTPESAKQLAQQVAQWKSDGIDMDIEDGAGANTQMADNMVVFAQELRRLRPDFIITQPVFGYPQVYSESIMTVKSWDASGNSNNIADAVGIMVYSGSQALQYVGQYTGSACTQWWCPLCSSAKVQQPCTSVPAGSIFAGVGGDANQSDINTICSAQINGKPIGGYMIWYASADNGFQYGGGSNDARVHNSNWNCNPSFLDN